MKIPSYESKILDTIETNKVKAKIDKCSKAIISSRQVLARILQAVVPEYKECTIDEILPLIGHVAVDEETVNMDDSAVDLSEKVPGEGTEDSSITEGTRYYDMKFSAVTPDNKTIGLIINIEIQNDFNTDYPLIKRAIYYASRMISSQYGTIFTKSEYGKIQKVYSIWICTSPDIRHQNTISQYEFTRKNILGELTDTEEDKLNYDMINIITICLGESATRECKGIIRFLNTLLVENISAQQKKKIMEEEYQMSMTKELDEEVEAMCNVSERYWNDAVAAEKIAFITELVNLKMPVEMIAQAARISIPEVETIINNNIDDKTLKN